MNAHFEKAFEKLDECMSHMGKAIESVFDDISSKSGSKIRVKKGSRVYLGKGVTLMLKYLMGRKKNFFKKKKIINELSRKFVTSNRKKVY